MYYIKKNVFRGFHFQTKNKQSKYVNVIKGKILDIVIDLRKIRKLLVKLIRLYCHKERIRSFYTTRFAHAYFSYDKKNIIYYKLDNYYNPKFENGIIYGDPRINLKLPVKSFKVSKKDKQLLTFDEFKRKFKYI